MFFACFFLGGGGVISHSMESNTVARKLLTSTILQPKIDSVVNHCHGVHAASYAIRPLKGNEMFEPSIDFQKICLFSRYKHNLFKTIDEMENLQGCTCKHVLKNDQATCKDRSSLVQLAPNWEVFSPLQKISCSFTWKKLDKGNVFVLPGKWTDSGKLT